MPAKGCLNQAEKEQLQQAMRKDESPLFRERCLMLLLMDDGKTYDQIAEFIGCSRRTVAYWCVRGEPGNLESLRDGREQGNHRKATEVYIQQLMAVIDVEPSTLGYEFGCWTGARLAEHLAKETGIQLSSVQLREILRRKKYVYLWTKYSLEDKQDPPKRAVFKQKLAELLAKTNAEPEQLQVWFWDESGFSLRVIRRKSWTKKGQRTKVLGQRRRGRVNVMGGLREHDRKRLCFFVDRGNADNFLAQLRQLYDFVQQEWSEQGNQIEQFQQQGPKIVVILDNASYHKRQDIKEKIQQELPNLLLEFLPAYSPDLNLIELLWHSCKEYIAQRLFSTVEQLKELLNKLLNQGGLEIKWRRKIKNKGDALIAS